MPLRDYPQSHRSRVRAVRVRLGLPEPGNGKPAFLRPGDAVWLSDGGTPAPFSIESHEAVEHGQAWLNPREMAAMEVQDGDKLTAASAYHETPSALEEPQASDREP